MDRPGVRVIEMLWVKSENLALAMLIFGRLWSS